MGFVNNFKSFIHSITTEDHYASYQSPYKDSLTGQSLTLVGDDGVNSSTSRLNELHNVNNSSSSLVGDQTVMSNPKANRSSGQFVGYRPGLRSSTSNLNGSDLQLQTLNQQGQPPLPSMDSLWDRLEAWMDEEYPELSDNLNDGVTSADLNELENDLRCGSLPTEFRQMYKKHDGQFTGGKPTGMIMGLTLLDIESIAQEHTIWCRVADRLEKQQYMMRKHQGKLNEQVNSPQLQQNLQEGSSVDAVKNQLNKVKLNNSFITNQRSIPPNSIQPVYYHRGWIPVCRDLYGNQVAMDLAPGPAGTWGQMIIYGRDYDTKLVIASSLQEFLFNYVSDLEQGKFQIDNSDTNASFGYLEASRNDDDFIGDEDEGQGELAFYDREGKEFGKVGIPLTYLEVNKRRALKKYGINNVDSFLTSFVPQQVPGRRSVPNSKNPSPMRSAAGSRTDLSNPLINVDSVP